MMTYPRKTPLFSCVLCAAVVWIAAMLLAVSTASAQRNLKNIPDPDPELERQTFILPEGFEVNLYASDPRIAKPIQMNFDERGRLWVASSEVYPHIKPGQQPTDKILVLEDVNRDGTADRTTVFADGLLIPTGVLPGNDGAYVVNSTELLHLQDTNQDGRADKRQVVLSGFGTEDTHHLLHTLRWGHDGAMYMNQSIYIHSHIETPYGVRRLNGGGIWRFRPDTLQLDVVCNGFVNPWGHHFDKWGQQFATDGAYGEGINYVFPGAVYVTAPGAKRRLQGLNPGSPKHCGLEIVSGDHLPESWQGSMLTNDFRAHRVCRFVVTEDGAGYQSRQEVEVIKSTHVAFRPIDVKVGPDGAIYIADWYNPIIQHGEVDFRDPRRDHVHGRIWRVTAKDRPLVDTPAFSELSIPELLTQLERSEQWIRLHAKRELTRRAAVDVKQATREWLAESPRPADEADEADAAQQDAWEHRRLEALWLQQMMRAIDPELLKTTLASDDHRVRAAAIRVASHWPNVLPDPFATFARAAGDEHPRVRLEAVRALSGYSRYEAAAAALSVLDQPMDRFLDFALWRTMRDLESAWLPKIRDGQENFGGSLAKLSFALQAVDSPDVATPLLQLIRTQQPTNERLAPIVDLIGSLATPEQYGQLLEEFASDRWSDSARAVGVMSVAVSAVARKVKPAGDHQAKLSSWLAADDAALRAAALRAAGALGADSLHSELVAAADASEPALRIAALQALADLGTPESRQALVHLARDGDVSRRAEAINILVRVAPQAAVAELLELFQAAPDLDPSSAITAILSRKNGAALLQKTLAGKQLAAATAKRILRAARSNGAGPELESAIRQAGDLAAAKWKPTAELIQQLAAEAMEQGDPRRGEAIYRRRELQCARCHAIGGSGGRVGPDLISVGASAQPDYLVEALLDPNAKVKENFHSLSIQTEDGIVVSGIVVRKDDQEVVLRDKDDKEVTVPVDEIAVQKEGRSLMPDGTVDDLTRQELIDMVRFLAELGKVGEFSVSRRQFVRTWRVLLPTKEAYHRIRRTSYDTAASDDPALTFEPGYSRVNGELPVNELPGFVAATYVTRQPSAPTAFVRCRFEVTQRGKVSLEWNDVQGLTLWVNGKPTPIAEQTDFEWPAGEYDLTIAVNRQERKTPLRIELLPASDASVKIVGGK